MAVANSYVKEQWMEWRRRMGISRRRWRDSVSWTEVEVSSDETEDEADVDKQWTEDAGSDQEESEMEEEDKEMKVRRVGFMEEEGENWVRKMVKAVDEELEDDVIDSEEDSDQEAKEMQQDEEENVEDSVTDAAEEEEVDAEEVNQEELEEMWREHEGAIKHNFEMDILENEEIDEEDEHLELEQTGPECLAEQFRNDDKNMPDSDGANNEEEEGGGGVKEEEEEEEEEECTVRKQFQDSEKQEDLHPGSWGTENGTLKVWTWTERKEKECESSPDGVESWTTPEPVQDGHQKPQEGEEELTDAEDGEHLADEDSDCSDEYLVKIYREDDYVTDLFSTLTHFKDSSLLTDLNLTTDDGTSFRVHSPVLAAVSSLIHDSLSRRNADSNSVDKGTRQWSVSLGPEVHHVGLGAVVEFAYTGFISCLSKDTIQHIKAASEVLGACRVLDLCTEEEHKFSKTGSQKENDRMSPSDHMMISLQSIKKMWMDRVGCDVLLEALGGSFHVHRVILAACCDYFRGMFTSGMRESHQSCVALPYILASELEALIDCSYSGALDLSWMSVFELTTTALQLQYKPAFTLCLNYLQQEINPHSCLDVASFAEAYEMAQLLEIADDYVLRQFEKVACTSKFKDLPAKQLFRYLNSHSLCVPSELVVFKAVVAWIQAKPKIRLRLAKDLMRTIHFPLMTFKEFKEVQSLNMWSDHNLAELYEAIFEDFCSNDTTPHNQCRIYLPKESLVLIGGDQTSEDLGSRSISRELWFGNSLRNHTGIRKAMEWRKLSEMPDPGRYRHEVTVLKGQLYVFGGKKYYGLNDTLNSVYRYDPLQDNWEILAGMLEKRCSFSVVLLDGKIYAIGGHCDPDYLESVEQYCPDSNSWSFACPLDLPLGAHVAKVTRGQIFVSGGMSDNDQCLASMFVYHPETGSSYLANMATPRAYHCMETLSDCLYVAGGSTSDHNMAVTDQLACEVYNPATDSWATFAPLPVPHAGAGSVVLEGKFYLLGGYSQEDYSDTMMVHRYDPSIQRWENMGKMPGPNNDIRASLLCLPPHFRQ